MSDEPKVESIEEQQARTRLWIEVKQMISTASKQALGLITGLVERPASIDRTAVQEEIGEILHFSCEYCVGLLKEQPIDEKSVWEDYDSSRKLLDIVTMIPYQWQPLVDKATEWRNLPPLEPNPFAGIKGIGREDYDFLKRMPRKHNLELANLPSFRPKYKLPAQLKAVTTEKKEA